MLYPFRYNPQERAYWFCARSAGTVSGPESMIGSLQEGAEVAEKRHASALSQSLINFNVSKLTDGVSRLILPGADS